MRRGIIRRHEAGEEAWEGVPPAPCHQLARRRQLGSWIARTDLTGCCKWYMQSSPIGTCSPVGTSSPIQSNRYSRVGATVTGMTRWTGGIVPVPMHTAS